MLKLGDKVRLKTAKRSLQTSAFSNKRIDADTDRVHTITQMTKVGVDGCVMYSCNPTKTGLHWLPEQEFELVESSTNETKFNLQDAVVIHINKHTRVRNKTRKTNIVSIGSRVPATIIGMSLRGRDEQIEYLVIVDNETVAFVDESDIERKDYTLF